MIYTEKTNFAPPTHKGRNNKLREKKGPPQRKERDTLRWRNAIRSKEGTARSEKGTRHDQEGSVLQKMKRRRDGLRKARAEKAGKTSKADEAKKVAPTEKSETSGATSLIIPAASIPSPVGSISG